MQATGSAQKGGQVQQLSVPRVQQVPQQVRLKHRVAKQLSNPAFDFPLSLYMGTPLENKISVALSESVPV